MVQSKREAVIRFRVRTLPEANCLPLKIGHAKRKFIFQPPERIFVYPPELFGTAWSKENTAIGYDTETIQTMYLPTF